MFSQLKWFLLVSKTILGQQPSQIFYIVMLGFTSRIAATLALLLPVKVIMMAGRHNVPSYFPELFNKMEMTDLMVLLSVVAVVLYVVHVVLEGFFSSVEKKGTRSFLQSLNIDEEDDKTTKILQKCYQKVADSMTELFFVTAVVLFTLFAFPVLFVILATYTMLVVLGFEMIQHSRSSMNESADGDMDDAEDSDENDNSQIARWVDVGFLVGFLGIVVCVLLETLPNIILVLVSFLLIRRASGGVKKFLKTVVFLEGHRPAVRDLIG
jgi:chromate transport protein ChrA